ncbi:hypothetical protein IOD13_16195 [Brevibacterium casei]|nr:hypothetical protein [Brevibacterium casei]
MHPGIPASRQPGAGRRAPRRRTHPGTHSTPPPRRHRVLRDGISSTTSASPPSRRHS